MSFDESGPPSFERDELDVLLQAPLYVAIAVLLIEEVDPVQFLRRLRSAAQILVEAQEQKATFSSLAAFLMSQAGVQVGAAQLPHSERVAAIEYELLEMLQQFGTAAEGRELAIALCDQIAAILAAKAPYPQAQAYCNWLLSVAHRVAETLVAGNAPTESQLDSEAILVELRSALTITPN